ncbi:MAG: flagellar hook-length control protein FliK, partial [Burkholderiaceae bacterium]
MNLPALPAVAAPRASGTPPKNADESGAAGFAKFLDHAREGQAAESAAPEAAPPQADPRAAHQTKREDETDASEASADAASEATPDAPCAMVSDPPADAAPVDGRARLRAPGLADRARKDVQRAGGLATAGNKGIDPAAAGADAAPDSAIQPSPPDIAALLPGWTAALPSPPLSDKTETLPADGDAADAADDAATPTRGGSPRAAASTQDAAAACADARAGTDKMAFALPEPAQAAAQARPAASAALEAATPKMRESEPGIVIAAPATSAPTISTLHRADAVATAHVAAPLDTPAFAPALATQVRWLAQERVSQAQITLNPAGMGPVAVQIVIEGALARVDFSADQAATRQAIEASLPVLAAALDESGLKLSGGGVHDGGAQRHPAWGAPAASHRTPAGLAASED